MCYLSIVMKIVRTYSKILLIKLYIKLIMSHIWLDLLILAFNLWM